MKKSTVKTRKKRSAVWLFILTSTFIISIFAPPESVFGQELHNDLQGFARAKVLKIIKEEERLIAGTETKFTVQTIEAKILEGEKKSQVITLENDYTPFEVGDTFFVNFLVTIDGQEIFSVRDADRRWALMFFAAIFAVFVLFSGGWQGFKALIGLAGSLLVILYVLLPLLLKGYPPVMTSTIIATVILFFSIYFTHGFNRASTTAFLGTVIAVFFTGFFALMAVKISKLTGFATDEAVYLNFATFGSLDFSGLLLGGIIVGALGVLDDIAITQSAVVSELLESAPHLSKKEIYKKALRVGRDHAGALVNTLALAYAGATLPLLLLFSSSMTDFDLIVNQEPIATEIIRTIVGSIGLVLTIPITTFLAVFILDRKTESKKI